MLVGLVPQSAKADKLILMVVVKFSNAGLYVFIDAIDAILTFRNSIFTILSNDYKSCRIFTMMEMMR